MTNNQDIVPRATKVQPENVPVAGKAKCSPLIKQRKRELRLCLVKDATRAGMDTQSTPEQRANSPRLQYVA